MSKKSKFPEIQAELKQRELESREIRKRIRETHGMDRWHVWVEKREFGDNTRYLLLAYAYLRKVPYRACEPKCRRDNSPSSYSLHHFLMQRGHEVSKEDLAAWLETPAPVAEQVAA